MDWPLKVKTRRILTGGNKRATIGGTFCRVCSGGNLWEEDLSY